MNTNTKAALLGAFLTAVTFTAGPALFSRDAKAQEIARPQAVAGAEQYRIISLNSVNNEASNQRMEELLNRLAADGWRVRTGVGVALVLAK